MMRLRLWGGSLPKYGAICVLMLNLTFMQVAAQEETAKADGSSDQIVFIPPAAGAPADRVGAATRDIASEGSILTLLVPERGGVTTHIRPPLVWHLSETHAGEMSSQITPVGTPQLGAFKSITSRFRKGYYALDLARSDFQLQPDTIYEWTVVLTDARTGAVSDWKTAYVEMVTMKSSTDPKDVQALAAQGLWFDALAPFVEIGLSGRVRIDTGSGFVGLTSSANLPLP
jgi:hypothetical protein